MKYYTLDRDNNPVLTDTFPKAGRVVEQTYLDEYYVSTVFLAFDHGFENTKPVLWETMIFPLRDNGRIDYNDLYCDRYTSYDDAQRGHRTVLDTLRNGGWPE